MTENGNTMRILIAGFGGQGVLFLGKLIAGAGCAAGKQVTWLPSYGPEMRGGTANSAVVLSDEAIGSPIVSEPDVLIVMNLPSFLAYEPKVRPGGTIILDSSLIDQTPARTDIAYHALPATRMAADEGLDGLSNMILLGRFWDACLPLGEDLARTTLEQVIPAHKKHLLEANLRALALGRQQPQPSGAAKSAREQAKQQPRRAG